MQTAQGIAEVNEISEISQISAEVADGSRQVRQNAKALSGLAEQLDALRKWLFFIFF